MAENRLLWVSHVIVGDELRYLKCRTSYIRKCDDFPREKENPISFSFVLMDEQKHQVCDLSLQCQVWIDNTQILTRYWMLALWLLFFYVL